jgi:hypothetical protein
VIKAGAVVLFIATLSGPLIAAERIAVLPFKGDAESIGNGLTDALITEFFQDGFTVMERGELLPLLVEKKLERSPAFEPSAPPAGLSGVDSMITGSITTHLITKRSRETLEVDTVTAKWLEAKDGKVLSSVTLHNPKGNDLKSMAHRLSRSLQRARH